MVLSKNSDIDFIKHLHNEKYIIWNVEEKKPIIKSKINGENLPWSRVEYDTYNINFNSNSYGLRTGPQPNGKFIISLDFDLYKKNQGIYEECNNTKQLYKDFEKCNPNNDGIYITSTENNRGCLVDITNCSDLINIINNDGRSKIQKNNYCLEVMCGFNVLIPPTLTTCKIRKKAITPRAFLNNDAKFLILNENTKVYELIYNYITSSSVKNTVSGKNIKRYNKKHNYLNIVSDIEDNNFNINYIHIKPFLEILSKDRINNYGTWFNIGMAIKNICSNNDKEGFKLFNYFSSLSEESYNIESVKYNWNKWNNYKNEYKGLNHNYILSCANLDNPDTFYIKYIEYIENLEEAKYKDKLTEFEKECKYILQPPIYLCYNDYLNNWNIYKQEDLIKIYKVKYGKEFIKRYIEDENIKNYTNIDFVPNPDFKNDRIYNTFNGFYINNKNITDISNCDIIKNHINNICNNNENTYNYFSQWLAHLLFNTTKRPGIVPVIQGKQGSGKGTLYNIIEKIIGKKYCLMSSTPESDIFTRFNDILHEKILININEAEFKNFTKTMEIFKSLITDNTYNMESKNVRRITLNNYMWFLITTNNDKLFNISSDDRRFFFIKSNNEIKNNKDYFNELYNAIEDDKIIYSYYQYLKNIFNPDYNFYKMKQQFKTNYHKILENVSKHPFYTFLNEYLEEEEEEIIYIKPKDILFKYNYYCRSNKINNTETGKSIKIKLLLFDDTIYKKVNWDGGRSWFYVINKTQLLNYLENQKLI